MPLVNAAWNVVLVRCTPCRMHTILGSDEPWLEFPTLHQEGGEGATAFRRGVADEIGYIAKLCDFERQMDARARAVHEQFGGHGPGPGDADFQAISIDVVVRNA